MMELRFQLNSVTPDIHVKSLNCRMGLEAEQYLWTVLSFSCYATKPLTA